MLNSVNVCRCCFVVSSFFFSIERTVLFMRHRTHTHSHIHKRIHVNTNVKTLFASHSYLKKKMFWVVLCCAVLVWPQRMDRKKNIIYRVYSILLLCAHKLAALRHRNQHFYVWCSMLMLMGYIKLAAWIH